MSLRPDTSASLSSQSTGVDAEDGGEDDLIQKRKNKRLHVLIPSPDKRQEKLFKKSSSRTPSPIIADAAPLPGINTMGNIPAMARALRSDNVDLQLEATFQFCELLSNGSIPLIDQVIQEGVVPHFVKFLKRDSKPDLQSIAASALTNVVAGTSQHTRIVIEHGAVPPLVQLLSSSNDEIKEEALWTLSNIAADSPNTRDHVLSQGALLPLLSLLRNPSTKEISLLKRATLTLSNLCCQKPLPDTLFEQIKPELPVLWELLMMPEEVVLNVCWTLSYLTQESSRKTIQAVVEANVCPRLVGVLSCTTSTAILPALLTLGDIAAGSDSQIVIKAGVLPCLQFLLTQSADENILKSACWAISNIIAGTRAQVQAVIDAELIVPLVHLSNAEFDIRKEAARAIANATYFGTVVQIEYLVSKGCIKALCDLLTCTDPEIVAKCLKGLEYILDAGEICKKRGINSFAKMVSEIGGLETIVSLQSYGNNEICNSAVKILKRYWPLGT